MSRPPRFICIRLCCKGMCTHRQARIRETVTGVPWCEKNITPKLYAKHFSTWNFRVQAWRCCGESELTRNVIAKLFYTEEPEKTLCYLLGPNKQSDRLAGSYSPKPSSNPTGLVARWRQFKPLPVGMTFKVFPQKLLGMSGACKRNPQESLRGL